MRISQNFDKKKIVQVACGKYFSMALTENGEVYSWGCNYYGQLGITKHKVQPFTHWKSQHISVLPKIGK